MIKHIGIHISYGAGGEGAPAPEGTGAGYFKRRKAWWKRQHMAWLVVLAVMLVV
jgi:hypothetical protein